MGEGLLDGTTANELVFFSGWIYVDTRYSKAALIERGVSCTCFYEDQVAQ